MAGGAVGSAIVKNWIHRLFLYVAEAFASEFQPAVHERAGSASATSRLIFLTG
jgi:hypothetical protein